MNTWKDVNLHGAISISRVVSVFEIETKKLPGERFKIKILEQSDGNFIGMPNVCAKNSSGIPEWICGLGKNTEEALEDALKWFTQSLDTFQPKVETEIEWVPPQDF